MGGDDGDVRAVEAQHRQTRAWLESLDLTGEYAEQFEANHVAGELLAYLTDTLLKELGVAAKGDRIKILEASCRLLQAPPHLRFLQMLGKESLQRWGMLKKKKPVLVRVGYKFEALEDVDCVKSRFSCRFKLFATWDEQLLVDVTAAIARSLRIREMEEGFGWEKHSKRFFNPALVLANGHNLDCLYHEQKVTNRDKGTVKLEKVFSGWLSFPLDGPQGMKFFPFDFHDLHLLVRSENQQETCNMELQVVLPVPNRTRRYCLCLLAPSANAPWAGLDPAGTWAAVGPSASTRSRVQHASRWFSAMRRPVPPASWPVLAQYQLSVSIIERRAALQSRC